MCWNIWFSFKWWLFFVMFIFIKRDYIFSMAKCLLILSKATIKIDNYIQYWNMAINHFKLNYFLFIDFQTNGNILNFFFWILNVWKSFALTQKMDHHRSRPLKIQTYFFYDFKFNSIFCSHEMILFYVTLTQLVTKKKTQQRLYSKRKMEFIKQLSTFTLILFFVFNYRAKICTHWTINECNAKKLNYAIILLW